MTLYKTCQLGNKVNQTRYTKKIQTNLLHANSKDKFGHELDNKFQKQINFFVAIVCVAIGCMNGWSTSQFVCFNFSLFVLTSKTPFITRKFKFRVSFWRSDETT